jgi:regulation of enolase protein 1 (concanavalin A-like superfamily)
MNKLFVLSLIFYSWLIGCTNEKNKTSANKTQNNNHQMQLDLNFDTSLNNAQQQMQKESNKMILSSTKETDYFIEPGGVYEKTNAPLLLKKIDNTKPFTFIAKLTPEHNVKYDAGMAFIYVDEKHWLKFAFEADEQMNTRIVTVRTTESSDDNNHETVKEKTVYLKISSDTKSIGFYYSTNGTAWHLVRVFKNEYQQTIYIGVGTQSPAGNGNKTIFEGIEWSSSSVKDFRSGI